ALSRTRDPRPPRTSTLFPYTTLFRSHHLQFDLAHARFEHDAVVGQFSITFGGERLWRGVTDRDVHDLDAFVRQSVGIGRQVRDLDRKSTRLNSSHVKISYAVFCLKKD